MTAGQNTFTLEPFPPLAKASSDGLLAVGGDLSPQRLKYAYSLGIFPWYEQGQPILWWSPDPRCVLYPDKIKVSRSLLKSIKKQGYTATIDTHFKQVIDACAAPRGDQAGTWITSDMRQAYCKLHKLGYAHSVEVWHNTELVGGLYGISLGKVFYGESMFSLMSDASKFALKYLSETLLKNDYKIIDCQVESAHLLSLGAQLLPRQQFIDEMEQALALGGQWLGEQT